MSDHEKGVIDAYRALGWGYRRISRHIGRGRTTIRAYIRRNRRDRKEESRRPRITTSREDRNIVRTILREPRQSLKDINKLIPVKISESTLRRRLAEADIVNVKVTKKPYVNNKNRICRLNWCKEHIGWKNDQWDSILWSDESLFVLEYSGNERVWVRKGMEKSPIAQQNRRRHQQKVMIWGCMCSNGLGRLYRVEGSMRSNQYLKVLEDYMIPSATELFD